MDDPVGACSASGEGLLDDTISIIRLLRVFLGATVEEDEDSTPPPAPSSVPSSGHGSTSSSTAAAAREQAGCTLWDMSADEGHASAMCAAGLAAVSCKVLHDCANAKARHAARALESTEKRARDIGAESPESTEPELAATAVAMAEEAGSANAAGETLVPPGAQGVERLREVACGLLANVCSHRGLRRQIVGSPSLGEKLLRAFHDSDDPAPLTELLRLFSAVALTKTTATARIVDSVVVVAAAAAAQGNGGETPAGCEESMAPARVGEAVGAVSEAAVAEAVDLALGLAERETLERLAFFLENSLEERLLAWACSLTYSLLYRHGDAVIRPLVDVYRLEESLAALLNSRSTDLAYEKLGGTETGLDVLLRCLEVLSTSAASSLGPSPPPALATPPGANGVPADATAGVATAAPVEVAGGRGGASEVRDSEQQQQQKKRRVTGGEEEERVVGGESRGKARRNSEVAATTTTTTTRSAFSRRERRGSVIRGLVATLAPWEHSRRSQRAALLVLGNVLGNALEEYSESYPKGCDHGEERDAESGCASQSCAVELDKGLATWDAGGEGEWGGEGKEEGNGEAGAIERLASMRLKFQEAVNKLVEGDEQDGLEEELKEAEESVKNVLEQLSKEPRSTNTVVVGAPR